jgi:hypothetical protein
MLWKITADPLAQHRITNIKLEASVTFLNSFKTPLDRAIIRIVCATFLANDACYRWLKTDRLFFDPKAHWYRRALTRKERVVCSIRPPWRSGNLWRGFMTTGTWEVTTYARTERLARNLFAEEDAPDENRPQPGGASETVMTDGSAIILTGHETTALPRSRGALRSLWRTHWGRHRLAASHLSSQMSRERPQCQRQEAWAAANCMVLHPACHDDPVSFYHLHGFWPDNLRRK